MDDEELELVIVRYGLIENALIEGHAVHVLYGMASVAGVCHSYY